MTIDLDKIGCPDFTTALSVERLQANQDLLNLHSIQYWEDVVKWVNYTAICLAFNIPAGNGSHTSERTTGDSTIKM